MTPPRLVIDTSVAMKWLVEEEGSAAALALQGSDMVAPALMRIEAANVLATLVRRGAVTAGEGARLFDLLQSAPVRIVESDDVLEARALAIAAQISHPVYDCLYLALAERTDRVLVTADRRFLGALSGGPFAAFAMELRG